MQRAQSGSSSTAAWSTSSPPMCTYGELEKTDVISRSSVAMPSRAAKIAILSAKPAMTAASRRVPTVATGRNGALLPPPSLSPLIAGSDTAQETRSARQRIIRDLEQRRLGARQPTRQQEIWRNVADIQRKLTDNLAAGRSQAFLYDDLHRLTQGIGAYGQIDYAYDAVGNRTDRTVTQGANVTAERRRAYLVQYSAAPIVDPATGMPKHFATPVVQS